MQSAPYILEDDEGSVDAADSVVAEPRRDFVRGLSRVAHGDGRICVAALEQIINTVLETSSGACCKTVGCVAI